MSVFDRQSIFKKSKPEVLQDNLISKKTELLFKFLIKSLILNVLNPFNFNEEPRQIIGFLKDIKVLDNKTCLPSKKAIPFFKFRLTKLIGKFVL